MTTRLPDRLHDLASDMPLDVEGSTPRVVRRARRRRGAAALVATAAVVAIVVGGASALRVASPDESVAPATGGTGTVTGPNGEEPSPAPVPETGFAGLWPETSEEALAEAQAQVDDGHQPLRLDPEQTAVMLATNLFGWTSEETVPRTTLLEASASTTVVLSNTALGDDVPPISVVLAQLGRTGPDGIWSVVRVSSPLVEESAWVEVPGSPPAGDSISAMGHVTGIDDGPTVRFAVLAGAVLDEALAEGSATFPEDDPTFYEVSWPTDAVPLRGSVLWIFVADGSDTVVGATAIPLSPLIDGPVPVPEPTAGVSPTIDGVPVPKAVAERYTAIQQAALDRDVDALAPLIDPNVFSYNFGAVSDPIAAWREDPSPLDTIAVILEYPAWVNDLEGSNVTYVWPSLMEPGSLDDVSDEERALLHDLGFTEAQVDQMIADGTYLGPRLGIDESGTWIYYVTGGD